MINAVIDHFDQFALVGNQCFWILVTKLATNVHNLQQSGEYICLVVLLAPVTPHLVISQTISWVSQKRLLLRQESPYLLRHFMPSSSGSDNSCQVCHTTLLPHLGALASVAILMSLQFFTINIYKQRTAKYSQFLLKNTGFAGSSCFPLPPRGAWEPEWYHVTFSKMDTESIKVFSALCQSISRHLMVEAHSLDCAVTDPPVIMINGLLPLSISHWTDWFFNWRRQRKQPSAARTLTKV